jgi:AcrR family transcriptional regulator
VNETREHQQEKLLRAACELVAEKGVAALRTRDIASRAGVGVGTLHYCFATKHELLKELYLYIFAEFRRATEHSESSYDSTRETLEGQSELRLHFLRSDDTVQQAWRAFTREAWTNPNVRQIVADHYTQQRERFERIIARRRADGDLAGVTIPDSVLAAMMLSLFDGLSSQWRLDPSSVEPEEYVRAIHQLLGLTHKGTQLAG